MSKRSPSANRQAFVNCPFDATYQPIFNAIVFTLHVCGCTARSALEVDNAAETRFEKIVRIIRDCDFGIHDISRTEVGTTGLPRFNMPFELGLFLGAIKYGRPSMRRKTALIIDRAKHRYQEFISDIAGQDVHAHDDEPANAIIVVRNWLAHQDAHQQLPGGVAIGHYYTAFTAHLPALLADLQIERHEIQFVDFQRLIVSWIAENVALLSKKPGS